MKGVLSLFGKRRMLDGVDMQGGIMSKERKWEIRKSEVSWGEIMKYAHRREKALSCGLWGKQCNKQAGLCFRPGVPRVDKRRETRDQLQRAALCS